MSATCGRNRRWQRVRGLSHISNWKKEIDKVSAAFHSADSDDSIFLSLWDSSGGGGGSSGARVYQVRQGLCLLSVRRRPTEAFECSDFRRRQGAAASYHRLPRTSSAMQANHQLEDLVIKHFEPIMHWSSTSYEEKNCTNAAKTMDIKILSWKMGSEYVF